MVKDSRDHIVFILRIPWMQYVSNKEVSSKIRMRKILILTMRKRQYQFLVYNEGRGRILTLTRHTVEKRGGRKQLVTYLMCLCKWMANWRWQEIVRRQTLFRSIKERITHIMHTEYKTGLMTKKSVWIYSFQRGLIYIAMQK